MKTTNIEYITSSEVNQSAENENSVLLCKLTPNPSKNPLILLAISDGTGGYEHGEDVSLEARKKNV